MSVGPFVGPDTKTPNRARTAVMRARSDAFVDQIHVGNGQLVTQGQPIVTLRNDDLVVELGRRKTELARAQGKLSTARWLGKSSEAKAAQSRCDSLIQQVEQMQRDVDQLTLVAPVDGIVIARQLARLQGTYVKSGSETAWEATIDRIETRADTMPIDDSPLAINGGSLASIQDDKADVRLVSPRVSAFIRLTPEQSLALRPGRRASVALGGEHQALGKQLLSNLQEFLAL